MAILLISGATASLAVAGTTLAFSAAASYLGTTIAITIAIPGTATVTGISDGSTTFTLANSAANSTTVRTEIWTGVPSSSSTSRTITITFSGSTLASACYEIYTGEMNASFSVISPTFMTANNAPSPFVVATSSEVNSGWHVYFAYQGGSGGTGLGWGSAGASNEWISCDMGVSQYTIAPVNQYTIVFVTGQAVNNAPKNFIFQGSNDNSTWTALDTRTNETSWSAGQSRTYSFSNTVQYRYYRLFCTVNNGGSFNMIGQLLFGNNSLGPLTRNTNTATGTSQFFVGLPVTLQDNANSPLVSFAVATNSGDTFTALDGVKRQAVIPALTTAASALFDQSNATGGIPGIWDSSMNISASRAWAAAGIELRTGATGAIFKTNVISTPTFLAAPTPTAAKNIAPTLMTPVFTTSYLANGTPSVAYTATLSIQSNGLAPYTFYIISGSLPSGLSLNASTGVISGTPVSAGTSVFTVFLSDRNGWGPSWTFSLTVAVPVVSSGGNYAVFK